MSEALVLLPGLMGDSRQFWSQIEAFGRERAVMVAPVTLGERMEEIASMLLGQLPLRFALLGQGFGGMVALELIRRAPERVSRIALLATSPLPETPADAGLRETRMVVARAGRLAQVMAEEIPADSLAPGPVREDILALAREMAEALGPEAYLRQARALQRRKDQQATLRRIRQPAMVLCGAHDRILPIKRHEFMAEMIPYARLEVIDEAGHLPSLETPETVNAAIHDWLRQPMVLR